MDGKGVSDPRFDLSDPTLLRGVHPHHIVANFDQLFGGIPCVDGEQDDLYHLSKPVAKLDLFVSHSWQSQKPAGMSDAGHKAIQSYCRTLKRLAFLFSFNLEPALGLAWICVAAAFAFQVFCASNPDDVWIVPSVIHQNVVDPAGRKAERGLLCQICGFLGLGCGLLFGGFHPPRVRCFLDKCCVDQNDEGRKSAAVSILIFKCYKCVKLMSNFCPSFVSILVLIVRWLPLRG